MSNLSNLSNPPRGVLSPIGQSLRRRDDVVMNGHACAVFLRRPDAHARIEWVGRTANAA